MGILNTVDLKMHTKTNMKAPYQKVVSDGKKILQKLLLEIFVVGKL